MLFCNFAAELVSKVEDMGVRSGSSVKMDMVSGGLFRKIVAFSLPLLASGILQQSFNSVDVAVVGKFTGSEALAAVGSNGPVISILVNLFIGISVGANVVIANYIGQRNDRGIERAVNTVSVVALASGVALMLIGVVFARPILELMDTPHDVISLAVDYLRIFFLGMPFMMIYNFGAAIYRSMGDTKRPFYSLLFAGVFNIGLDLLLVVGFGMGVKGVAIATVVANAVNAAMMIRWLSREAGPYKLRVKRMSVSRPELRKMLQIGVPAGLQGMVFSLANIFIQSAINRYGSDAVAGSSAALTYEVYCYFVVSAFCQAAVAFVSQNYGAGRIDRCRRVFKICLVMSLVCCGALNLLIVWQKGLFISIFSSDPDVFRYAAIRLETALLFQWMISTYEVSGAALRGFGYSMTPTAITIFGTCVLRLVWVYTVGLHCDDFSLLLMVYPISWVITGASVMLAYRIILRRISRRPPAPVNL